MPNGVKGAISQTASDIGEAVVKPVGEELGKAIEEGVSTVVHGPQAQTPDPNSQQKKLEEEQKKKNWALRVIGWYKNLEEQQRRVREAQKQNQLANEEKQQEQKVKQFQVVEKKKGINEAILRSQAERRSGRGVGG